MFDFIKKLAYVVAFLFAVYSGFQFGMPYYRYYAFKTDAADIIVFNYRESDAVDEIRKQLTERAQELGIPISPGHIKVYRTDRGYWAEVKWQETVDILGQYQKTLRFEVEVGQ